MEFLKTLFNDKALTFDEFVQAINAHNGNEENKENQIKLGNLGSGEYVAKGKYDNLQSLLESSKGDVKTLTDTIESLKKGKIDTETLQSKVAAAEKALMESQEREKEMKLKYALDVAFLAEGVKKNNAELLTIALERRMKEQGETLELDGNDSIVGWDDKLSGLKTQFPTMFETNKKKIIEPNKLPESDHSGSGITQEQFNKMGYQSRLKLKQEQPEVYAEMTGKANN